MSGFWYTPTAGYPVYGSQSSSILQGNEENLVKLGFDKLATPTGYANHIVKVSNVETGYDFSAATLTSAGVMAGLTGLTSTGAVALTGATVTVATQAALDNSTKAASTAYADAAVAVETARAAPLASPTFTGVVTIPAGASIAGYAALAGAAFSGAVTVQAPTASANPASKSYVDAAIGSAGPVAAWVSGNTYLLGVVAYSPINFQTYRHITATSSLTTDPSLDKTNWALLGSAELSATSYFLGQL